MKKEIVLILISVFLISACAKQNPKDLIGGGTPVPQNEIKASAQSGEVKEFKITAKQFQFEPAIIEINRGDKVRLVVTSTDVPHGFTIPEYGINERLDPGKPATIQFTADKQGTFTAFCSVFCGSGHSNMKGKIVVR